MRQKIQVKQLDGTVVWVELLHTYHDGVEVRMPGGTTEFFPTSALVVTEKKQGGNRPGAGRPKSGEPKSPVQSYMPEDVILALTKLSVNQGISVSNLILQIVKDNLCKLGLLEAVVEKSI